MKRLSQSLLLPLLVVLLIASCKKKEVPPLEQLLGHPDGGENLRLPH